MARRTSTRTSNKFTVIEDAPSVDEFLNGATARNEYDLTISLVKPVDNPDLHRVPVKIESDNDTKTVYATGIYRGVNSVLLLTT